MRPFVLIRPLERRNSLTLLLVQRVHLDLPVPNINLIVRCLLEGNGVFHPFGIIPLWIIFTRVSTTGFLAVGGRLGSLNGACEKVAQLESLDKVTVPDHAPVFRADLVEHLVDLVHSTSMLAYGSCLDNNHEAYLSTP